MDHISYRWLGILKDNEMLDRFRPIAEKAAQSLSDAGVVRGPAELVILDPAPGPECAGFPRADGMLERFVIGRPEWSEAAPYYFRYIDRVSGGQIVETVAEQLDDMLVLFSSITEEQSLFRYADDRWSIRQVLSHITDTERVFALRAFKFARGFETALPSYDQEIAAQGAVGSCPVGRAH